VKTRREREAELVALMLFDLPHLRSEFWRVVINDEHHPPLASLSSAELIRCILEHEYPGEGASQVSYAVNTFRRRPR
jgi:hypothetical protein